MDIIDIAFLAGYINIMVCSSIRIMDTGYCFVDDDY